MKLSNLLHAVGYSDRVYNYPLPQHRQTFADLGIHSPAHKGIYSHAVDFVIPDPRTQPLPVFAPATGKIIDIVQQHDIWGPHGLYVPYLNYVTVQVTGRALKPGSEFYELGHIGKNSCPFKIGAKVKRGERICSTGLNGWVTKDEESDIPDFHLHFLVGVWKSGMLFNSLRIRYSN